MDSLKHKPINHWLPFALNDIRNRFARSYLGPLWISISTAVLVAALAYVFGNVFSLGVRDYLPYVACGVVFWSFMNATILESATGLIENQRQILNVRAPVSGYVLRTIARNLIIWILNVAILIPILTFFTEIKLQNLALALFGFLVVLANIMAVGFIIAVAALRYRDLPHMFTNIMQVLFFLTPVFWSVEIMTNRPTLVVGNPFFHFLEITRKPLLTGEMPLDSLQVAVYGALVLVPISFWVFRKTKNRIPFWV